MQRATLSPLASPIYLISTHPLLQSLITDAFALIRYRVVSPPSFTTVLELIQRDVKQNSVPAGIILDLSYDCTRELAFLAECQRVVREKDAQTTIILLAEPRYDVDKALLNVQYLFQKPFDTPDLLRIFTRPLS